MMKLLLFLSAALSLAAQTPAWTEVCNGAGTTCAGSSTVRARGFQWTLPYDSVNNGMLYLGGNTNNSGIYSNAIWFYNPATSAFSQKVDSGITASPGQCSQDGAPYNAAQPRPGHPLGYWWAHGTTAASTIPLCGGYNTGRTSRYDMSTQAMTTTLAQAPFGCSGNDSCTSGVPQYQSIAYVPTAGKSILCCSNGSAARLYEFDGSTWGTDLSASMSGSAPPTIIHGQWVGGVGNDLWVYGGCSSSDPISACGTGLVELYKMDATTYVWTQLSPVGGVKPPTHSGAFPIMAYDSTRNRFWLYADDDDLWFYSLASNTWTQQSATGTYPTAFPFLGGAMMNYDPDTDKLVLIASEGQSTTPAVYEIDLGSTSGQLRILSSWPSGNAQWIKACGLVPSVSAGGTASVTLTGPGGLSIPLTIQEAIYSGGTSGVARTNEPFCVGVPIADSSAITSTAGLALSGTTSVADANLATDGSTIAVDTTVAVFGVKKANFNGIDTAAVGGTTIIATSASATRGLVLTGPDPTQAFPANVTCSPDSGGSTCATVYSSARDGSSTCTIEENGPVMAVLKCTGTHYDASANPYMQYTARLYFYAGKASVKAVVSLRNANYSTAATPSADCNVSGGSCTGQTFNTAWKGLKAYELRLGTAITGTLDYTIANDTGTPLTGTLDQSGGTDLAYIYQGGSSHMILQQGGNLCYPGGACADTWTTDQGFTAKKNSTTLDTGIISEYPAGWADIRNSSGVGVEIGMLQFAAMWPASLEFQGGGAELRVGLVSGYNSGNFYVPFTAYHTREAYLIFHTAAPTYADEFLRLQHPLIARATRAHYNTTSVFPYPLVDSTEEDTFYGATQAAASPSVTSSAFCWSGSGASCLSGPDRGIGTLLEGNSLNVGFARVWDWSNGGPQNQEEFRLQDMWKFLQRGHTGRYYQSDLFYRFYMVDRGLMPHADGTSSTASTVNGFTWRSRPRANVSTPELSSLGLPVVGCYETGQFPATCANARNSDKSIMALAFRDLLHTHWSGMISHYYMTGDEAIKDSLVTVKDAYLNENTYLGATTNGTPTRAVGIDIMGASRYAEYLASIGDSDAAGVLAKAVARFDASVKTDTCVSGYPTGCTPVTANTYPSAPDNEPAGVNRKRGIHTANSFRGTYFCTNAANPGGIPAYYRAQTAFQQSILIEGLLALRRAKGSGWSDYALALDLIDGMSKWNLTENYSDDGLNHWYVGGGTSAIDSLYNGFRYGIQFDHGQKCTEPTHTAEAGTTSSIGGTIYNNVTLASPTQGMWMSLYARYLLNGTLTADEQRRMKFAMQWVAGTRSSYPADWGGYQLGAVIHAIQHPETATAQNVSVSVLDNGGGSYTLSWTPPSGVAAYRLKWSTLQVVDWIGFDPIDYAWTGNPATQDNWFASTELTAPASGASSITVSTGQTGLTSANFALRAMATGSAPAGSTYSGRFAGTIR
jgi:hypothetical protein